MKISWFEALLLILLGVVVAVVLAGRLEPITLILVGVLAYFAWMARGVIIQARRVRPVEPPITWAITMIGNLILMALGIGAFGWYLAGAGARAWVPFLIFIAGMLALRAWRREAVKKLYAWRTPALALLQKGEYRQVIRSLEAEATAGRGHPDKLAMVALAYIELNKLDTAEQLLLRAKQIAPDYASVNGALGSLRRHQARYAEAVEAIQAALAFEENANSRYYLGLNQYLAGDRAGAQESLLRVMDDPTLIRLGQVYGAYMLGQIAEQEEDRGRARDWYARMAEAAPQAIPALEEEARRHKQTPYGETLKEHIRDMQKIIARRPLEQG